MKKIEEIFKQKLANKTAPYSDDLWSKIEKELDESPQNQRFLPLFISLGILLLSVGGIWFYYNSNSIKTTKRSDEMKISSSDVSKTTENTEVANSLINANIDKEQEDYSGKEVHNSVIKPTTLGSETSESIQSYVNAPTNSSSRSSIAEGFTPNALLTNTSYLDNNRPDQRITKRSFDTPSSTRSTNFEAASSANAVLSDLESIRSLQLSDYSYQVKYAVPRFKNIVDCSEDELKKPGFSLDLYFSPEFAAKDLNAREDGSKGYLRERNRTENSALSYSTGARFSYTNASGLSFRTGFNYTQINETLDYSEQIVERIDTNIMIIISEEGGETTTTIDTSIQTFYGQLNFETRNNFKSIDIPILIGLEMPINHRLSLSINSGVYINTRFKASGRILNPELKPVWINDNNSDSEYFKTSLGVSFYGSLGLHHLLSPGLELLVEPNMRYYSQSFTVGSYPLTQDYIKFGVLTGLRYKF